MSRIVRWIVILSAIVAAPLVTSAQTPTFSVEGVVADEQASVLPGVTVTIRNVATGLTRSIATDASGRYVFSALPPEGRYELRARLWDVVRGQPVSERRCPPGG